MIALSEIHQQLVQISTETYHCCPYTSTIFFLDSVLGRQKPFHTQKAFDGYSRYRFLWAQVSENSINSRVSEKNGECYMCFHPIIQKSIVFL